MTNLTTHPRSSDPPPTEVSDFLVIDEEGYFVQEGLRVADVELGREWLSQIRIDELGRAHLAARTPSHSPLKKSVFVEAFDQPLVAHDIDIVDGQLKAKFPYDFHANLAMDSLRVDEWDRFHARTVDGVPLVLNRSAQARFFEQATDYDDDSVTIGDLKIETRSLFDSAEAVRAADWWSERYKNQSTPWDLEGAHPFLEALIPPLKFSRSRVLILGCGAGHDAAWWEKRGHIVTGVDFSEEALSQARARYGESENLKWVHADALKLPAPWTGRFDIVFEHTMFCAIPPSRRAELVRQWWRLLSRRGRLLGFVPVMDKTSGPPFGVSEWELRRRLLDGKKPLFLPLLWNRRRQWIENRKSPRPGQELFFAVERADSLTD